MNFKFYSILLLASLPIASHTQEIFFAKSVVSVIAPDPKGAAKPSSVKTISVADVPKNIGRKVNLCGKVFNAKELKLDGTQQVILKMGGEYVNERLDVQIRFDEAANFDVDFQKVFLQKNVCINGTVIDAFGVTEIYIDTIDARRMIDEAIRATPEIDTPKVQGNPLKLLANAYMLEGPKWKMPVVTHLKEGSIIKVEKVQSGWVYAKVIVKNGSLVDDNGIYGFISYQALGLTRKGKIESTGKVARN